MLINNNLSISLKIIKIKNRSSNYLCYLECMVTLVNLVYSKKCSKIVSRIRKMDMNKIFYLWGKEIRHWKMMLKIYKIDWECYSKVYNKIKNQVKTKKNKTTKLKILKIYQLNVNKYKINI